MSTGAAGGVAVGLRHSHRLCAHHRAPSAVTHLFASLPGRERLRRREGTSPGHHGSIPLARPHSPGLVSSCHPLFALTLGRRVPTSHLGASSEIPDFLPTSWRETRGPERQGPKLELSAEDAVQLQLSCLQQNDVPHADHGVEVMYRFASIDPFQLSRYFGQRLDLGHFDIFRRMFHHSTYRALLGHRDHHIISSFYVSPVRMRQRVRVLGLRPGEDHVFEFTLVQREGGSWDGYWFTESLIHDVGGSPGGIAC